jgi:hypothetical protein
MTLKDHVPIIYSGGTYGSFLSYVLECVYTGREDIKLPFEESGNSHQSNIGFLHKDRNTKEFTLKIRDTKFVRYHPKTRKEQIVSDEIDYIINKVDKAVLIYPTENTTLLTLNNYTSKIWDSWLENEMGNNQNDRDIFLNNLYDNWDIKPNTKIDNIPKWILREFLSFYLMPAWQDQVQWNLLEWYQNPKVCIVTVDDIIYNFYETISKISKFCNLLPPNPKIKELHTAMLAKQVHTDKDNICNKIITSFNNSNNYTYDSLSLIDEAWIQWELRNQGYELKCNNLNKFPTTIKNLKKITYKA